jgi:hypothetical protein
VKLWRRQCETAWRSYPSDNQPGGGGEKLAAAARESGESGLKKEATAAAASAQRMENDGAQSFAVAAVKYGESETSPGISGSSKRRKLAKRKWRRENGGNRRNQLGEGK